MLHPHFAGRFGVLTPGCTRCEGGKKGGKRRCSGYRGFGRHDRRVPVALGTVLPGGCCTPVRRRIDLRFRTSFQRNLQHTTTTRCFWCASSPSLNLLDATYGTGAL